MPKFTKNKPIIPIIILILIIGGIVFFLLLPKERKEEVTPKEEIVKEEIPEIFSLSAIISKIDIENNFLIVKIPQENQEFKVYLSESTKITKLKFPFDLKNPPPEATFIPEKTSLTIEDLKIGDHLFIVTTKNIYGKTEFNDVSQIQVLPQKKFFDNF